MEALALAKADDTGTQIKYACSAPRRGHSSAQTRALALGLHRNVQYVQTRERARRPGVR